MELFGKKKSESFDSCCSGLDDHLNHHHSPSHPLPHLNGSNHGGHSHAQHLNHHHLLHGGLGGGFGPLGHVKATNNVSDNKASTSNRNSSGTTSCSSRRKMSRWDQNEANHSTGSLLSTMQRFVQTVDDMNETILVPCRLMDLKFDEKVSKTTPTNVNDPKGHLMSNLNGVDLFQFYAVLNSVKNDLMWGSKPTTTNTITNGHGHGPHPHHHHNSHNHHHNGGVPSSAASSVSSTSINNSSSSASIAPSTSSGGGGGSASASTNGEIKGHVRRPSTVSTTSSASASDTEFSELNEDSGVEGEEEYSQQMSDAFHHHLNGLQRCLRDLTLAADYITTRYNHDLEGVNA